MRRFRNFLTPVAWSFAHPVSGIRHLHWLLLIALIVLPIWTALHEPALSLFAALFDIDVSNIRIEAAMARLLLLLWATAFVAVNLRDRISGLWRQTSKASLHVIAGSLALGILFVGSLAAYDVNVFFNSLRSSAASFPAIYLEDGLMENLTAAGYVLAAFFLLSAAVRRRYGYPMIAAALVLLALAGFLAAAEEISWGQRIFGWYTPDYFSKNNVQDETNLHNLLSWNVMAYLTMLLAAAIAVASLFAEDIAAFIPIKGIEWIVPSAAVRLALLIVPFTLSVVSYNELTEEIVSWIFLCYSVQKFRTSGLKSSTSGLAPAK